MQAVISPHIKYTNMASLQSTGEEKMFVDISQAMERIQLTQTVSSLTDTACCNPDKWQKPITEFGQCDPELLGTILRSDFVGDIDCGSADWTDSCQVVDAVMDLILKQLQELAGKYEGLCIKEYIRQGSAREGLKKINDESLARAAQSFIDEMMPELGVSFGVVDPHQAQVYDMFESLAVSHAM
ncbi:uncharacterized protein LOC127844338 isoform X3 [Dreissena polymorpha]|uniref:uncharacterized protein LOC127844338 isoform X3 n=1 Tax=Dreissena polymorpha TaxID=45954 RepID=UPI002263E5F5|nr:uncharacterized protein LOC127844338 isoform X3 [Dreissena polymorpha]